MTRKNIIVSVIFVLPLMLYGIIPHLYLFSLLVGHPCTNRRTLRPCGLSAATLPRKPAFLPSSATSSPAGSGSRTASSSTRGQPGWLAGSSGRGKRWRLLPGCCCSGSVDCDQRCRMPHFIGKLSTYRVECRTLFCIVSFNSLRIQQPDTKTQYLTIRSRRFIPKRRFVNSLLVS